VSPDARGAFGQNLQDHLEMYTRWPPASRSRCTSTGSFSKLVSSGRQWLLPKTGNGRVEPSLKVRRSSGPKRGSNTGYPVSLPADAGRYDGRLRLQGHGFFKAHVVPMRSTSRGSVTLASGDPADARQDFFSTTCQQEKDWEEFRIAFASPARKSFAAGRRFKTLRQHEIHPG